MESSILFSSMGATELLLALPEPRENLRDSYAWSIPEESGITVTSGERLLNPNPTPSFDGIQLYSVALKSQHALQPFTMVQATVHPPRALVFGKVSMMSHPVSQNVTVNCVLPAKSDINVPLMIAVVDNAGSTGYHWKATEGTGAGLKISSQVFQSNDKRIGAPATQVFFINVTEPGTCYVQIEQFPPAGKQPVSTFSVTYTAY